MSGLHVDRETTTGPAVRLWCATCMGLQPGTSYEHAETLKALFVLPVFRKTTTYVRCEHCGREYLSSLRVAELADHDGEDISPWLKTRTSPVAIVFAVASLVMFFIPFFGVAFGLIGTAATWRTTALWPKAVARAGLFLSLVVTIGFVILLRMEK